VVGFIIRTVVIAIAVAIVAAVYPSISYGDEPVNLIAASLVLGVLNAFVKPILKLLTLPINLVTFGLFGIVINAVLLLAVAWIGQFLGSETGTGFEFVVGGYPPEFGLSAIIAAVVGAVAISIVGAVVAMVTPD
jgi:putative membrane protein